MLTQRTTVVTGQTAPASDHGHNDYPYDNSEKTSPSIQAQRSLMDQDHPQYSMQYDSQASTHMAYSSLPTNSQNATPLPMGFQNPVTAGAKDNTAMAEDEWVESALLNEGEPIESDDGPPTTRRRITGGNEQEVSKLHHM